MTLSFGCGVVVLVMRKKCFLSKLVLAKIEFCVSSLLVVSQAVCITLVNSIREDSSRVVISSVGASFRSIGRIGSRRKVL